MFELIEIYDSLRMAHDFSRGWPKGEWPVSGAFHPERFEIVVGAVLTQNTSWKNVEKALERMIEERLVEAAAIERSSVSTLQAAIRPAGFYKQKSRYLKEVVHFILGFQGNFYESVQRNQLLSVTGIGPETADSILLYACDRAEFVVDAYTRRIFSRYGLLAPEIGYEGMKRFFESGLPEDVSLYKRFHALIVEHAKQTCRKEPACSRCVLSEGCKSAFTFH